MSEKSKAINTLDRLNNQLNELFNRIYQVNEGLLHKRVAPKSWNVIQVLEHLHETELLTLQYMKYKVAQKKAAFSREGFQAKAKYFVMRVLYALPLKFKAPKILSQPNDDFSFSEMQKKYADLRKDYQQFIEAQDESFFQLAVCKHPVVGRIKLIKMLRFYKAHTSHHEKQILRFLMKV